MDHIYDIYVPKDESHFKIDLRTISRINNATNFNSCLYIAVGICRTKTEDHQTEKDGKSWVA